MSTKRLILVEDNNTARLALKAMVEQFDGIEVVAEASNGAEAVMLAQTSHPDLIMMDIEMPVMDGISATRKIKQYLPDVKVLMFTAYADAVHVRESFAARADGYCPKMMDLVKLQQAIQMVLAGQVYLDPNVAEVVRPQVYSPSTAAASEPIAPKSAPPPSVILPENLARIELSNEEMKIMDAIIQGSHYADIAEEMGYSMRVIENMVTSMIKKLTLDSQKTTSNDDLKRTLVKRMWSEHQN